MQSLALISKSNKLIPQLLKIWKTNDVIVNVFNNTIAIISSKGRIYIRFWGDAEKHYGEDAIKHIDKIITGNKYYYLVYYSNLDMLYYFIKNSRLTNDITSNNEKKSNLWLDFSKHGY